MNIVESSLYGNYSSQGFGTRETSGTVIHTGLFTSPDARVSFLHFRVTPLMHFLKTVLQEGILSWWNIFNLFFSTKHYAAELINRSTFSPDSLKIADSSRNVFKVVARDHRKHQSVLVNIFSML